MKLRPNPSIEWTSTGWARYARCSFSASRAPSRLRPLMSNVRQHRNVCALPSGGKFKCARALAENSNMFVRWEASL
jgi:hypothetical protein